MPTHKNKSLTNNQQNIAKAQKEIEKLEAEADDTTDAAQKPSEKNQAVNGDASAGAELAQEKDAVADAAKELESAKIEDATTTETAPES